MKHVLRQFIIYGIVGSINTLVSYSVYMLLLLLIPSQAVSLSVGAVAGVVTSYVLNSRFTFKKPLTKVKALLFTTISLCLAYLCGHIGDAKHLHPFVTFLIDTAVFYPVGFTLTKLLVFKK